jgi:hypothetical protein
MIFDFPRHTVALRYSVYFLHGIKMNLNTEALKEKTRKVDGVPTDGKDQHRHAKRGVESCVAKSNSTLKERQSS